MGSNDAAEEVDILITGAGLSGINAGYRVQTELPHKSFAILEARDAIGGTWNFWKYPAFRSDSTMRLFGLSWYPWPDSNTLADGPVIRKYLEDAAVSAGLDKKVRFGHRVTATSWSSEENRWTVSIDVLQDGIIVEQKKIKAWWVINGTGYYNYEKPRPADIPGIENFQGQVVHPQFWDANGEVDYAGKRVVIIGSGATTITLLPAIAKTAAHVTMLQRSPSYVFSLDKVDPTYGFWKKFLPTSWANTVHWWHQMLLETVVFLVLSNYAVGKRLVRALMRKQLPKDLDMDVHFNPSYYPFQQRLCFCPEGDFFRALSQPNAAVATGTIDSVTENGIRLSPSAVTSDKNQKDPHFIPADLIITATGLYFELMAGIDVSVDGVPLDRDHLSSRCCWNSTMLEGLPNSGFILGYTAATWTPGAETRTGQLIKVIKHLDKVGALSATPCMSEQERANLPTTKPAVSNNSTYFVEARDRLPRDASYGPWRIGTNFWQDWWFLVSGRVEDGMKIVFGDKKSV